MSAKNASTKTSKPAAEATAPAKPAKKVAAEKPVAEVAVAAPAKVSSKKAAKVEAAPVPVAASTEKPAKTPRSKKAAPASSEAAEEGKVRRVVNNEEVEKSFDELLKNVETELQSLRDNKNHNVGIRFLRSVCRQVKSLKNDSVRLLSPPIV